MLKKVIFLLILLSIFIDCNAKELHDINVNNNNDEDNIKDDADGGDIDKFLNRIIVKNTDNNNIRIIGGVEADWGDFKGAVSLQYKSGQHFCGGTLINENFILTAAHCIAKYNDESDDPIYYQAMADDLTITKYASSKRQIRSVSNIIVHPKYEGRTLINDIGIIRLTSPFALTSTLQPIVLSEMTPEASKNCSIAGWGVQSFDSTMVSANLMKANIMIMNSKNCNESYEGFIQSNMFCAGMPEGGRDSCQGDSGGGLVCNNILCGIVSFGLDCGLPGYPGVYTDVSMYIDWISKTMENINKMNELNNDVILLSNSTDLTSTVGPGGSGMANRFCLTINIFIILFIVNIIFIY